MNCSELKEKMLCLSCLSENTSILVLIIKSSFMFSWALTSLSSLLILFSIVNVNFAQKSSKFYLHLLLLKLPFGLLETVTPKLFFKKFKHNYPVVALFLIAAVCISPLMISNYQKNITQNLLKMLKYSNFNG